MSYSLEEINRRAIEDPKGFVQECDLEYENKIRHAADLIEENMDKSVAVLLSGPSGSGKTTTSQKIQDELRKRGINTHAVGMDNYFRTVSDDSPRTPDGELDLESPHCVDMDLFVEHIHRLEDGGCIEVPKYNFAEKRRDSKPFDTFCLGEKDVVIAEGIHAFNDEFTDHLPNALKIYISARSNVMSDDELVFKGTWMRLVRRVIRDAKFRGASPAYTMGLWANVRRGEKINISPYKDKAVYKLDSSFPYEVCVMKSAARELFKSVPKDIDRYEELSTIYPAFDKFECIDPKYVTYESILREFIGGGKYKG